MLKNWLIWISLDPVPTPNNVFGYIRSFPPTTPLPVTAAFRRFATEDADIPSSTSTPVEISRISETGTNIILYIQYMHARQEQESLLIIYLVI